MTLPASRRGTRLGAVALAATALAGVLAGPQVAAGSGAAGPGSAGPASVAPRVAAAPSGEAESAQPEAKRKKKRGFLTADQWPTWVGMPGWEHGPVLSGKKPPGMYCATAPLPDYYTRHREFQGGPAWAVQHTTWMPDEASAARLAAAYLSNAGACSAAQLAKAMRATSTVEPLGNHRRIGDGLSLVGVFYHVPAYGFIEPYDAMRLYAVGRVERVVTTLELWRDGTRASSRIKPFRELAKVAVPQFGR